MPQGDWGGVASEKVARDLGLADCSSLGAHLCPKGLIMDLSSICNDGDEISSGHLDGP